MRNAVLFAVVIGIAATVQCPMPSFAQDPINLKRVYKTGDVDKYKTVMTIVAKNPQSGTDVKIVATILTTDTTEIVTADGTATLKTLLDDVTLNVDGMEVNPPGTGLLITTTVDKSGQLKEQKGATEQSGQAGVILAMTRAFVAPDKPLKIGEEVKLDYPAAGTKDGRVKGTLKLISKELKSDTLGESIKVATSLDVPVATSPTAKPVKINSTGYIDPTNGKIYKIDGVVLGTLGMLPPGAKITFTVEKLPK